METTSSAKPFDWIKKIEEALEGLDQKPQFYSETLFPWEALTEALRRLFPAASSAKLSYQEQGWITRQEMSTKAYKEMTFLSVGLAPLQEPLYWGMPFDMIQNLVAYSVQEKEVLAPFLDSAYVKAFFRYFSLEVLSEIKKAGFASALSLYLRDPSPSTEAFIESQEFYVWDVFLKLDKHTFCGSLLIPQTLRDEWNHYFEGRSPPFSEEQWAKVPCELALEIGSTTLSWKEWKGVKEGDFIFLEQCLFDPQEKKKGVLLTLNEKPIFRGRIKEGNVKLLEYPLCEEGEGIMEEDVFEEEDDDDVYGEEIPEEPDLEHSEGEGKKVALDPGELPMKLVVELGRVRMTAREVMNLSPGSLLELHLSPEQGVDLVVNGKKIGKAEVIRLGEKLGIRILSL